MSETHYHARHRSNSRSGTTPRSVAELAAHVGGVVVGDPTILIRQVASLADAADGDITYVDDPARFAVASAARAACIVVPEAAAVSARCRIESRTPKLAFVQIAELLLPGDPVEPAIHPTAAIEAGAEIHPDASIGPHVSIGAATRIGARTRIGGGAVIGGRVTIGDDCVIHPHVVVYPDIRIGHRVILHAGASVGADGFGYVRDAGGHRKFPQAGTVIIEDDVELGAGACVDRGALGATRIGQGSKLDNLVHVGHNVDIGERVIIAAQTGISGSVVIEDDVMISGQVGFGERVRIRRGAMIGARSSVLPGKIVRGGQWCGTPVQPLRAYKRLTGHWRRLPKLRAEVSDLQRRLRDLEASAPVSPPEPAK